jgi:hypothetical protein
MVWRESDILIVPRARESRVHGEGVCTGTQHAQENDTLWYGTNHRTGSTSTAVV